MLKHQLIAPEFPKRVVILGGSGFIGQELITKLQSEKVDVIGLSSKQVDLCQPNSVDQLKQIVRPEDSIVFTSALTPDKGKDARTLMRNLEMATNLATFIEQTKFGHFVHISSDAVYDSSVSHVNESTPPSPGDLYGVMHLARELIIKTALAKAKIPYAILRPTGIYGAKDTHNSYGPNRFVRLATTEGKITLFGGGEEKRDHIWVKDAATLIARTLAHRSEGTLNLVTGQSTSFFDLAQLVVQLRPRTQVIITARANPVTYRHYDTTATIKAFPDFKFASLEEGLKREFV